MSIRPVEDALDQLCSHIEDCHILSTAPESFIDQNAAEIDAAANLLYDNDRKLTMIRNYVDEWEGELERVNALHEAAIERRDMLIDIAKALKKKFPAMRLDDALSNDDLKMDVTGTRSGVTSACENRVDQDSHSYVSGGAGSLNPNASVLRDVINDAVAVGTAQAKAARSTKAPRRAPIPYVTRQELGTCSRHMVGRLTEDKVNAALEELAGFAEQNAADFAKLKSRSATFRDAAKRRRFQDLEALAKEHKILSSRMWFLLSDTKRGSAIKFDKSGQALLQVLRQLKRVSEIRCKLGGEADIVYVYEST